MISAVLCPYFHLNCAVSNMLPLIYEFEAYVIFKKFSVRKITEEIVAHQ